MSALKQNVRERDLPSRSRRDFIIGATVCGSGLAVYLLPGSRSFAATATSPAVTAVDSEVSPWVSISADDIVTIRTTVPEVGNGGLTQILMTVTEELECDWSKVRSAYAPPNRDFRESSVYSQHMEGASYFAGRTTDDARMKAFLQIGASTRERLKAAAADRWVAPVSEVTAKSSVLTHTPTGRTLRYGEVAKAAATVKLAQEPQLKPQSEWTFLGKSSPGKVNNPLIVEGRATYGLDVRLPNMLYAALRQSPVHGGRLKRFDFDAIRNMPGVHGVVVVDPTEPRKPLGLKPLIDIAENAPCSAVAVVADHYWQARNALDALPVEWDDGAGARWKTTQQIYDAAIAETQHPGEKVVTRQGDANASLARSSRKIEAVYVTPLCDHMVMEPLNGTAMVTAGRVDLWHPTQQSQQAFRIAAEETGVALENVHFHQTFVGGAFGRRAFGDDVRMVVAVAKRFQGRPVQVVWSREETTRQGRYRPVQAVRLIAGLGPSGMPNALLARVCGHGIFNIGITDCAYISGIRHFQVETQELPLHIYPGPYRGPGYNSNAFVLESFIDECADEAGIDPLEYRRKLLSKWPDAGWNQCLREVADKSGWGAPLPRGQGRGIAISNWAGWGKPQAGTTVAAAAHVDVTPAGELRILRLDVAFDCGKILNRDAALAQIEGGTIYGLNMTLNEELTVQDGRIVEGNFDQYPMLRLADIPRQLHVHLGGLSRHERFGMLGEPGVGPVGPAIANAIFRATGRRLRSTPFRKLDLRWA